MRALIFELRPADLEAEGLVPTLQKHIDVLRHAGRAEVQVRHDGYVPQSPAVERELFRIVQEALNNATKYSQADRIEIELAVRDGHLTIAVVDHGVDFDAADLQIRSRRLGITSMEERAEALGGRLTIESGRGEGARVVGRYRLPEPLRVLIVDDHAVVRHGLKSFLRTQDDIEVVGEAADGVEAVRQVRELAVDVVLMEPQLASYPWNRLQRGFE